MKVSFLDQVDHIKEGEHIYLKKDWAQHWVESDSALPIETCWTLFVR